MLIAAHSRVFACAIHLRGRGDGKHPLSVHLLEFERGRWHICLYMRLCVCEEELRWKKEIGAVFHLIIYQLRHVVPGVTTIKALCTDKNKQSSMQKLECPLCICTVMSSSKIPHFISTVSLWLYSFLGIFAHNFSQEWPKSAATPLLAEESITW